MFNLELSWIAVLVAAIVYMAIGAFWYSPYLFGKKWMEFAKIKEEEIGNIGWLYLVTFLASLLTSYVLGDLISLFNPDSILDGVIFGFWVWLGFVATTTLYPVLYGRKPLTLYFIDNTYYAISYMIVGAIFAAWP